MIGIIGGSGLEDPKILKNVEEIEVETPYGKPSSTLVLGEIAGKKVVIISRHGKRHQINPSNVPYRANIWALKEQGCTAILASSACGSLREKIAPGQFVFPDQFIDWTRQRIETFYDKETVCHIPMAEPFCPELRRVLIETARELKMPHHENGTVITIEGPRFSTKAESNLFRQIGADVINMSTVPEVVLAREAGVCYQVVAMSTDYDCWRNNTEAVSAAMVIETMKQNAERVKKLFLETIPKIEAERPCHCAEDIKKSIQSES